MSLFKQILSIPKTIFFNFKVFDIKTAIKLPIFVGYDLKIDGCYKNCIEINGEISRFMIKINVNSGSKGVNPSSKNSGFFRVSKSGKIIFNGHANLCNGISIRIEKGNIEFGKNFICNKNCFFSSDSKIVFGNNVLIGWDVNIRDSDGHDIYNLENNEIFNYPKPVKIGNNVWIAAKVDILKGSEIDDDCVVGYRSCITKKFDGKNCIIAGYPAKVIKKNIKRK